MRLQYYLTLIPSLLAGVALNLFGGWDVAMQTIVLLMIIDYITGVLVGISTKQVSSKVGFKGICKKICIFCVISVAYAIQKYTSVPYLRETTISFFICNEGISILENAGIFIPLPTKIKEVLIQLQNKLKED